VLSSKEKKTKTLSLNKTFLQLSIWSFLMEKEQLVERLVSILANNLRSVQNQVNDFAKDYFVQRALLRGLMNMHAVNKTLPEEYFKLQDELLQQELKEKKLVELSSLTPCKLNENVYVYQGDITAIKADAIVNSANKTLLGCFQAGHNCVDNCLHSAAGLQLRYECDNIVKKSGIEYQAGNVIITHGFNLPYKYVIHAVAPNIAYELTPKAKTELKDCYIHSLNIARNNGVKVLVFTFIGQGQHGLPVTKCAQVATDCVLENLQAHQNDLKIIFAVTDEREKKALDDCLVPKKKLDDKQLHPYFNLDLI